MEALGDGKAGQDERREQKKKKQVNFSGNFEEDDDDKRLALPLAETGKDFVVVNASKKSVHFNAFLLPPIASCFLDSCKH